MTVPRAGAVLPGAADTSTVSLTAATFITRLTTSAWPTVSGSGSLVATEKPGSSAWTTYMPSGRSSAGVLTGRRRYGVPLESSLRVTQRDGNVREHRRPDSSRIVPLISPRSSV